MHAPKIPLFWKWWVFSKALQKNNLILVLVKLIQTVMIIVFTTNCYNLIPLLKVPYSTLLELKMTWHCKITRKKAQKMGNFGIWINLFVSNAYPTHIQRMLRRGITTIFFLDKIYLHMYKILASRLCRNLSVLVFTLLVWTKRNSNTTP